MAIDFLRLKAWHFEDQLTPYTRRDCMLYALGLGSPTHALTEGSFTAWTATDQ